MMVDDLGPDRFAEFWASPGTGGGGVQGQWQGMSLGDWYRLQLRRQMVAAGIPEPREATILALGARDPDPGAQWNSLACRASAGMVNLRNSPPACRGQNSRGVMNTRQLSAAVALAVFGVTACGSDGPTEPRREDNSLVFTRADSSTISFRENALLYVWCGPWEDGLVDTASVQVLFGGPTSGDPNWRLRGVTANILVGQPMAFPNPFIWDQPAGVDLFIGDPPNELSTQEGSSSGSITFQRLSCATGGEVQFTIDAVVGSEFGGGPSVRVTGGFRGYAGQPPG